MDPREATTRRRLAAAGALALCLWAVVVVRLVQVAVVDGSSWHAAAARQQDRSLTLQAERGSLLDREGRPLAVSAAAWSAWADPQAFSTKEQVRSAAKRLAAVLDTDERVLRERLSKDRQFVWLQRQLPPERRDAVARLGIDGVSFVRESRRLYPNGTLLAHSLGFVGLDGAGLEGLELVLDEHVKGEPGLLLGTRDARGESYIPGGVTHVAPKRGADVVLTLDAVIQASAEREIEEAVRETGAKSGTVIVMFPRTGEIAAVSNHPTYDSNNTPAHPSHLRTNRAVASCYEPGSTLKMFTAAAALEAGARPADVHDCENGGIRISRSLIRDHDSFGRLSVADILAKSSNVGAIKLGRVAGAERLDGVLRRFGFGRATGIDLPGESAGILRPVDAWSALSLAAISFGQEMAVTPIQLASASCAIANGGTLHQPRIVREIRRSDGVLVPPVRPPRRVLSAAHAAELSLMLEGVVEHGTGKAAAVPGYRVAGKTGTAQKIVDGRYSPDAHVASFVGWVPARDPAIACLVILDEPATAAFHGGDVAAPVFAAIARDALRHLRVPPEDPSRVIAPDTASASPRKERGHA